MNGEANLELDLDTTGTQRVARVMVAEVHGYTRRGAPTLTADCSTHSALTREIERLKEELDGIADRAKAGFEGAQRESAGPRALVRDEGHPRENAKPHVDTALTVGEVMTREVKTARRNDRISVIDELMKVERFRHVVVLDEDDRVAGVVSHRDIVYGALAWTMGQGRAAHDKALESYPVKDVMATNVATVGSETPLGDAAALMVERKIGCLPVVDGEKLVGILTEGDFLFLLKG